MNFKRIISLSLVTVMLLVSLASCNLQDIISGLGGTTTTEPTTSTTTTTPTTTDDTTTTTRPDDTTTTRPDESTSTSTENGGVDPDPNPDNWEDLFDIITIAEAIEIAKAETSTEPTVRYYIRGTIVKVSNPTYGEMTISDGTGEIYVYGTYSEDGATRYPDFAEKPVKGDEVLLHCTLNTFNDTPQVKNARLIDFKKADKEDIDTSDYTEMSIEQARGAELGAKVSVTGVVARITFANGMKPSGLYLVDGTNSIYVYDADIAGQVSIGNTITVLGEKDMWILETETTNANKFGYKGCCQISSATLYDNDGATSDIDFSWCEEKSVKDIINIPVTENVTTTIFKTTALVKKVPGNGYVNYYFFDLDGETGAYTYTQCNGSDFSWLDQFDGKICTVYLSPMNAKSTATDCYFRFLPIEVIDEGFVYDVAGAPEHVVKYYAIDQFLPKYTGNPVKKLITSVSSELLGFENVAITYASSDTSVAFFEEADGELIFNCVKSGTVTITITATYGDYSYSENLSIEVDVPAVDEPVEREGLTVEDAIDAVVGEIIKVEGIVGPSLANQSGFYLIDETGAIAVRVDASQFEGLAIGQKVVIEGTKTITKDGGGQICIDSAVIVKNYFGNEDYSTESFFKSATMEDIKALDDVPESTIRIYVITATVTRKVSPYSTTYYVGDVLLYSGNAGQYAWLGDLFAEGEDSATLTVELAICDWNAKGLKGCALAVITEDGKIYNEYNFQQ